MTVSAPPTQVQQKNYLNWEYGIKSWLLTTDHKRIAILYLISITFFFLLGGAAASIIYAAIRFAPARHL